MKINMLNSENGSVLIVALIFLVLLTLMGVAATTTTNIELQIAHNEISAKNDFYSAEAAAMENIQELENAGDSIKSPGGKTWLHLESQLPIPGDIFDSGNWTDAVANPAVNSNNKQKYLTIFEGVVSGDSLDVSKSRVYRYRVVGRGGDLASPTAGSAVVEMGFKKAL
jgi:hypothetical protein